MLIKYLKKGKITEVTELEKCDFTLIYDYIVKHKEEKKNFIPQKNQNTFLKAKKNNKEVTKVKTLKE